RPLQVRPARQNGRVRRAGVEPHVEDVLLLLELAAAALRAAEAGREQVLRLTLVPDVRAVLLDQVRDVPRDLRGEQRLGAALAIERGDGHAPEPLARDAPVRARRDHVADALLAPRGIPAHLRDGLQRLLAETRDVEA